jgi:hypothetical protein
MWMHRQPNNNIEEGKIYGGERSLRLPHTRSHCTAGTFYIADGLPNLTTIEADMRRPIRLQHVARRVVYVIL